MIFRSRPRGDEGLAAAAGRDPGENDLDTASGPPPGDNAGTSGATTDFAESTQPEVGGPDDGAIDLDELDAGEWRELGPYDIGEVDAEALEEPDPDQPRIDLGSIVLAGTDGMELRLQVDENSQQIVSAMMIRADSALEVGAFAAPRSGGLWAEVRDELVQAAESAGGSANLVPGPYGVELRRVLPVQTPDGQQGYQPTRMWVAEGPRWMLRGIIYGQAALEDGIETPVAEILEAFRQIVVRRGDEAMAPGDLLPLSLPEDLAPQPGTAQDAAGAAAAETDTGV
ncbi:DUF3710 domain-containing protein [Microlunatus soli]|uniref:DUF3710 domain-containing protein n=1 Tax=Microlunatus soli TaxID=630515 RepID=A0A1H1M7Y4_9ACTN|nr:DUF3710 domain-containing protein [Microlunatus soli]SDR82515.1 Protein of unknown function [Microlunatus soli]